MLDAISATILIIIHSIIWLKLSDTIIIRFGIPRASPKEVEELTEKLKLRKLDPRLAYFIKKLIPPKEKDRKVSKTEVKIAMQKIIIPAKDLSKRTSKTKKPSPKEIYDQLIKIRVEPQSATVLTQENHGVHQSNSVRREETLRRVMSRETLLKIANVLSKKEGNLLLKALELEEFRAKDLKDACDVSWKTAKEWLDLAAELGILSVIGEGKDRYYRINKDKVRELQGIFFGEGG